MLNIDFVVSCAFWASMYIQEKGYILQFSKHNIRWYFEDDLYAEHFQKIKDARMLLRATWSLHTSYGHLIIP